MEKNRCRCTCLPVWCCAAYPPLFCTCGRSRVASYEFLCTNPKERSRCLALTTLPADAYHSLPTKAHALKNVEGDKCSDALAVGGVFEYLRWDRIWGMGYVVWGMGYGIRGMGYGVRSTGYGIWGMAKVAGVPYCKLLTFTCMSTICPLYIITF